MTGGAAPGPDPTTVVVPAPGEWVRGLYVARPEVSSFQPHGSDERWWTTFADAISVEAHALGTSAGAGPVEVEFSGEWSEPGEYGHMGAYSRTFVVRAIRWQGRTVPPNRNWFQRIWARLTAMGSRL